MALSANDGAEPEYLIHSLGGTRRVELDCKYCGTQIRCQRTEQFTASVAVAGLARLLQRGSGGTNASRTDRLRGALEPVRGGGQLGKIASARGNANLPLRLNRCFAEFRQQRINGCAVVSEPGAKHVPVERGACAKLNELYQTGTLGGTVTLCR